MKRIKVIIILSVFILLLLLPFIFNKTFLHRNLKLSNDKKVAMPSFSYYKKTIGEYQLNYISLKSQNNLNKFYEELFNKSISCYEGRYHYIKESDITIKNILINKEKNYRELFINYELGNLCESEYILDKEYFNELEKATFKNIIINKYTIKKGEIKTKNLVIHNDDLKSIIKTLLKGKIKVINEDINYNIENNYYMIEAFYYLNDQYNAMYIFNNELYTIIRIIDQDSHPKDLIINDNKIINIKKLYEKYSK